MGLNQKLDALEAEAYGPERFVLTVKLEMYKQDSRGVLPASTNNQGWQDILADMIDDINGVPVCTDTSHQANGKAYICGQHVSQMEDSDWRIASVSVVDA